MASRLLVLLLALGLLPSVAGAAPLLSIEFTVTSGFFASASGSAQGPITGGTIRWVPTGGVVQTPTTQAVGRFTQFSLTGPSGFFSFAVPIYGGSGVIATDSIFLDGFAGEQASGIRSGTSPTAAPLMLISGYAAPFVCAGAAPTGSLGRCGTPYEGEARGGLSGYAFAHSFTVGAEVVRTYVPEPGTGLLLGLALLVGAAAPALFDRQRVDRRADGSRDW